MMMDTSFKSILDNFSILLGSLVMASGTMVKTFWHDTMGYPNHVFLSYRLK